VKAELHLVPPPVFTQADARELAAIMNRARKVVLVDGLHLVCKTPQDCSRAFALLEKQGRSPERVSPYEAMCVRAWRK
jgi:hypothetical protein